MLLVDGSALVATRFYSLAEAEALLGIAAHDLLRLAGNSLLEVCVLVPEGHRAFAIDPGSTILWDSKALHERFFTRATPSKELGMPARKDDVGALILNWAQCHEVEDFGFSRQVLFGSGYSIHTGRSLGAASDPMRVRPIRMPLYKNDGRTPTDQSQWRFAIYRPATVFFYTDGGGYPEPEDVLITPDRLWILGRELSRLPSPIELSPLDVDVEFEDRPAADRGSTPVKARQVVEDSEAGVSAAPQEAVSAETVGVASGPAPTFDRGPVPTKTEVNASDDPKPEVIREDRGPVVLLPREEVERRINKGKSWIYERINKKHPNFNPAFPQPIRIGGSVGWIEAEVEAWNQEQIRKTRGS